MRFFAKYIFAVLFLGLCCGKAAAAVQVFAEIDRQGDIYVGESFGYHIIIDGADAAGEVDLSVLAEYNPRSAGNRTQTTVVNNQVSKKYIMSYLLTSQKEGKIVLESVTVKIGGEEYKTNRLAVDILKPGTTESMDLEVKFSDERCYVGQPVLMEVNFYIAAEVYGAGNILDPEFVIPALSSDAFYIEDPDIFDKPVEQGSLGAGINGFLSRIRTTHKGKDCIVVSFTKILRPRRSGVVEIAASSVSAGLPVGRSRARDSLWGVQLEYKRFMVETVPVSLTVLEWPQGQRPPEFYGLAGRYTISASAEPAEAAVGEPITLTIRIGGGRYLKAIKWPELESVKGLAENFKIPTEKASPVIEKGLKVFTQTIRAANDKVTEIPPIPLAFVDANTGEFTVARSEPVKLKITPTKILTNADMEGREFSPLNREVEAIRKGLSANYEGADVLVNRKFSLISAAVKPLNLALWALPLAVLMLSAAVRGLTHTSPEIESRRRVRSAKGRALRQLGKIASAQPDKRNELLASAMKQYIGERFGRVAGSLTAGDCYAVIVEKTADAETAARYRDIIDHCEAARYAWAQVNIDAAQINQVSDYINVIEKKSKR